ncbi:methyltetrahydrofolate--corrinoid methyltransferase [Desulfoluna limicola]|uniref:Methyltetrahydrofolate--corrinoid methyltransferase n=1 Tax=Desulfoluna limicola TaxID=2810562 RepID=A0ABN6F3L8_9BACT|nr:dihydropteroate synthase [Desulfoluna limicola]BCS95887.1 methyltetrahydrofolate--corrinoid methyltransferase [Desulfoluna limicola]
MRIVSDNFQIINPAMYDAVIQKKAPFITSFINRMIASGSDGIDLNLGPLGKESPTVIPYLLDVVRSVTHLPLFVDSPSAEAAQLALATGHIGLHINGFSLQPERFHAFLPLMMQYESAHFVGYLLSENGAVPTEPDGRLHVAASLFESVVSKGPDLLSRLIVDPVVVPLLWDEGAFQALEVIRTLRTLPELAGQPVQSMAGLSNLTSGKVPLAKRTVMEQSYIPLLAEAGLDYILMNTNRHESIHSVHAANLLTGGLPFSWEALPV